MYRRTIILMEGYIRNKLLLLKYHHGQVIIFKDRISLILQGDQFLACISVYNLVKASITISGCIKSMLNGSLVIKIKYCNSNCFISILCWGARFAKIQNIVFFKVSIKTSSLWV